MCGIAGIVVSRASAPPDPTRVELATNALRHRGPDEIGFYHDDAVALGHTRLSIIDPEHGSQPLANEDGSVITVYNGEIWNHTSLREELVQLGHRFASRVDTEVLVHGYEEWGEGLLDRLRGIFAFAVWDRRNERLLLARDRVGKQPLYMIQTQDGVAFGSDARTVLLMLGRSPALAKEHLGEFLFQRYVTTPNTLFEGVQRLAAGHVLTYDREQVSKRPYWTLQPGRSAPPTAQDLRASLEESVIEHLMSDVPLGIFLSGGVDSAAVLALMTGAGAQGIPSFTVGFEDPVYDERPWARIAAHKFGTEHHELVVSGEMFMATFARLAWYRNEPVAEPSELPLLLLAQMAGRHVKVVLTGDGGDELFGGFPKYRAERVLRIARGAPGVLARGLAIGAGRIETHRRLIRAVETLTVRDPVLRWASWFRSFSPAELTSLLHRDLRAQADPIALTAPLRRQLAPYSHIDPVGQMMMGDVLTFMPDNMLLRADKVLMAGSLEGRPPILDHRIVERALDIPSEDRAALFRSKKIFRDAIADLLPPQLLRQRKRGFPVPVARFLLEDDRQLLQRLITSQRALERGLFEPAAVKALMADASRYDAERDLKIFTLASLELWFRTNVDEFLLEPPNAVEDLLDARELSLLTSKAA